LYIACLLGTAEKQFFELMQSPFKSLNH